MSKVVKANSIKLIINGEELEVLGYEIKSTYQYPVLESVEIRAKINPSKMNSDRLKKIAPGRNKKWSKRKISTKENA